MKLQYPEGATPLDLDEIEGLLIDTITTQAELNTAEQESILSESKWIYEKNHKDVLSDKFFKTLHKKMFKNVWKWAGQYRKSGKSIGVMWDQVPVEIKKLCDDTKYWIDNKTLNWDETAARFHHRVVWIHPFPNGNGRFGRIITDLLMKEYKQEQFSWGQTLSQNMNDFAIESQLRNEYISSLRDRSADF